jgi:hypothetical protein
MKETTLKRRTFKSKECGKVYKHSEPSVWFLWPASEDVPFLKRKHMCQRPYVALKA